MSDLADATSPEVVGAALVIVPVGSIEQHGPHLPLDTDTAIATGVAGAAAAELPGSWVAPALSYGSSGEHQTFAGTSSIGTDALKLVVVELTRSLRTWADRVLFVNAHGGNIAALNGAVEQLTAEGHRVAWIPCATESIDLHAGRTETSLMLHLRPGSVRLARAVAGNVQSLQEILPTMRQHGVGAVSANGVLGDPAGANAEEGQVVLKAMTADVVRAVGEGGP
ncbi:MAG: mycofactocin biosynthesis peptidyl-dipeptidase MftE [Aeromicrobium sp.]